VASPTITIILKVGEAIKIITFGWKQDHGSSNKKGPFQQQQQPNYPFVPERINKLEDCLEKFMKAIMARIIETQVGQIAKQIEEG